MGNSYQSTNKKLRARQLRRDGAELARAGYQDSANQNFEMAELLDPTPREEMQSDNQRGNRGDRSRGRVAVVGGGSVERTQPRPGMGAQQDMAGHHNSRQGRNQRVQGRAA